MKTGILFAGQGSQHPGMGKDLYESFPAFRKAFDALTEQERQAAFEGPESELVRTEITQPVLLAFAAGVYNILREEIPGFAPDMAAGLSLGEYSALTAAGVFDFETALDLIRLRGRLMARQAEGTNAVMSAVIGMERGQLKEFVERAGRDVSKSSSVTDEGHEFVEIANYNCPGQIVISGSERAVAYCEKLITESGAGKAIRLAVGGPFHTSCMKPVGDALAEKFKEIQFGEMSFPVLFNYTGDIKKDDMTIRELLSRQVYSSVMFEDTIMNMSRNGIEQIIEVGPGKTLSGFVRKTDRKIKTMKAENISDIEKIIAEYKC